MRKRIIAIFIVIGFVCPLLSLQTSAGQIGSASHFSPVAAHIPAPEEVLGFVPGEERKLASWNQVLAYFEALAKTSDRLKFESLGKTTMDKPFVMATISAPGNLARLEDYKRVQAQLADPRRLGPPGVRDRKAAQLIARGKTVVLITCGIHSTEVGSYLSSMLLAHRLASSNDPEILKILKNTIVLLVPSLNPDGVDIVKGWYDRTLGTPYEGTSPPELYHKYVGHDNNRDWYAFTQVETKIAVDKIHNVWHPQIVHDIHQQGTTGSRLFLPPYMQPLEPNVPKQIVKGYTELGNFMAREMRGQAFKGITTNSTYDAWSPARAYSHYHGGVRILSETASSKIATSINLKFSDLHSEEGYDPQKETANFGPLWRGGEWRLRDITNYMTTAAFLLLRHSADNREGWLGRFYEIGKEAIRPRQPGELFAIIIPDARHRPDLLLILDRAGVEVGLPQAFTAGGVRYPDNTAVINMAQPYASFAKAVLERQHYPNLRDASGHPLPPYDVTAHTLSLLMGVEPVFVYKPFKYRLPPGRGFGACTGGGPLERPVAVYKSYVPAIDEGWTRWVIEHHPPSGLIRYSSITDSEIRAGGLKATYDTIIIPDQLPAAILNGNRSGTMPAEYTGGLGQAGVKALREFVEQGGTLVCLNRASEFAIKQFQLPVRDVVDGVSEKEFFVPGSILRIELDTSDPLAAGMPKETIAWVEDSPVFEIKSDPLALLRVKIIARYPANKDPLLSGWLLGGERIKGKAALVEVGIGKGRITLFGFRPQYRAQSLATYPLFFNAISGKQN